jgi:hypothetical protein
MRFRLLGRGMGRTYGRQRIQRFEARAASRACSLRGLRGRLRCPMHGVEPCTQLGRDYLLLRSSDPCTGGHCSTGSYANSCSEGQKTVARSVVVVAGAGRGRGKMQCNV